MKLITWAAVAVTALFVLMNLGVVLDGDTDVAWRLLGGVLGALGIAAAIGLAVDQPWGRVAVVGVAALNTVASVVATVSGEEGGVVGIVVGGLGAILGALVTTDARRYATA
jgi:uncharacterized membrane protein